jgi:hypothetical protein
MRFACADGKAHGGGTATPSHASLGATRILHIHAPFWLEAKVDTESRDRGNSIWNIGIVSASFVNLHNHSLMFVLLASNLHVSPHILKVW